MQPDRKSKEFNIASETEYLIDDVEELVNKNVGRYLDDQPFRIKVNDYMPAMAEAKGVPRLPIGINRIARNVLDEVVPGPRDFVGMDILFNFPIQQGGQDENPINIVLKWSDGIHARLAIVDKRLLLLVERGDDVNNVIWSSEIGRDLMRTYLESIGLPDSIWTDDFKDLMGDIYSARDIQLERHSTHLLDVATTLEISHDARYMTNDAGDKELVQELCLNIDHQKDGHPSGGYILGDSSYRNMFRFERNEKADSWKYRGTYAGRLVTGEFIDQLIQDDPKLGVPGGKLLDKALHFLSEEVV